MKTFRELSRELLGESMAPAGHTIEAHGVKGMKNSPWRKTFKSGEHAADWAEKNGAEIHAFRDLDPGEMKAGKHSKGTLAKEDVEGLDELHRNTLLSYAGKRTMSAHNALIDRHAKNLDGTERPKSDAEKARLDRKIANRKRGSELVTQRLGRWKEDRDLDSKIAEIIERRALEIENIQYIDEALQKSDPTGKWIHDFVHSDNPKFAGKSPEKRRQMAIAAYYAKQKEK